MTTSSDQAQFMLLLHQPNGGGPGPTPEELRHIMGRFTEWMSGMRAKGLVVATNGLDTTGRVLRGPRGASMTDGPHSETKEIVGGYVLVKADTFDQAIEMARDCPGLDYGMAVEVRPIKTRCDPEGE